MRGAGLLAAVLVITLLPLDAWASLPSDPVTKDTIIDSVLSLENETLFPDGNIIVVAGGSLTLTGCALGMADEKRIEVREGGSLELDGVDLFCRDTGGSLGFACWGKLYMNDCRLWHLGRFYSDNTTLAGGLNLFSSDCTVLDTTFNCTYGFGIRVGAGAPVIRGNAFSSPTFLDPEMISITQSRPVLENNTLTGNYNGYGSEGGVGVRIDHPAAPILANNSICDLAYGIEYFYIHQHMDNGSVAETNETVLEGNVFRGCMWGLMTSDSYMGHGQGRSAGAGGRSSGQQTVLQMTGDRFDSNAYGISSYGECPSVMDACAFSNNGAGVFQQNGQGMAISNCSFSNNSKGIDVSFGDLHAYNVSFDNDNISVSSSETDMILEYISVNGSHDTGIRTSNTYLGQCTVANSTIRNSASIGMYINGEATLFNDNISSCPFGVYRAWRGYGYGHGQGRDSAQGPTPQPGQAFVQQCRFAANERGVYTEGMTNMTSNVFDGNGRAVEVSSFVHPVDEPIDNRYIYNGVVDGLAIQTNLFGNNTDGIMFLATNQNIHDDGGSRVVRANDFVNNSIGVDLLQSDAVVVSNNFTRNSGWAFRAIDSETVIGTNDFRNCDRVWTQELLSVYVAEPPGGDWQAPLADYVQSENAMTDITDSRGETLFHSDRTVYGDPKPDFSPDGFPFYKINVTTARELGNGSVRTIGPVSVEARKIGVGLARETLNTDDGTSTTLYLQPTPDIVVAGLGFPTATPLEGDVLAGNFSIVKNDSYDPSHISLKDVVVEADLDGARVMDLTIPWLQPESPQTRGIVWTAVQGIHNWTVRADPGDHFSEADKGNNVRTFTLDVNGRPQARLEAPRLEASTGEELLFSGAGSSDDGSIAAYLFDFGDGTDSGWVADGTANHSFARTGTYDVRLKVRDDLGAGSGWSPAVTVSVRNLPPSVVVSAERTEVLTLEPVNLTALASDPEGAQLRISWIFGDGGAMEGRGLFAVSHSYLKKGTYDISMGVDDGEGGTAGAQIRVTVLDRPPVGSFLVSPPEGTVLTVFTFTPTASDEDGSIVSYSWDFGSGNSSTLERPDFSYPAPGRYNVSLVVTDDDGSVSAPCVRTVTVVDTPPVARARMVDPLARAGKEVAFDASASFDPQDPSPAFSWDFGDGANASGAVVRHAFRRPGTYAVRLTVSDRNGAESAATITVTVLPSAAVSGPDTLWTGAAWAAGMLAAIAVLLLLWTGKAFLGNAGKREPRRRVHKVVLGSAKVDVYAEKLARSRQNNENGRGGDRRSFHDQAQPARKGKK